ncbi:hypothetical protein STCU_11457 [Strigomonas culicis]|uniref:Uncharacterized protein n=1 Tax=Strigomonas culicis TaxID=28005 RepID=S9TDY4_9TRYP|nr:hypothetical protein STCU_11457 [Strigomonas culicis]|eukprot:EPY16242.1 hypothetical protein STCU_11457 [Strigomonas culicis]
MLVEVQVTLRAMRQKELFQWGNAAAAWKARKTAASLWGACVLVRIHQFVFAAWPSVIASGSGTVLYLVSETGRG